MLFFSDCFELAASKKIFWTRELELIMIINPLKAPSSLKYAILNLFQAFSLEKSKFTSFIFLC